MNCSDKYFVAFFTAFLPVFSNFLVLEGEPVKVFACPFAVKIDTRGEALESLFVEPLDAFEQRVDMQSRDRAQGDRPEFCETWNVLFNILETAAVVNGAAGDVVMVLGTIERKVNAEMLLFAKIEKFVVEQRAVCIDGEIQLEIFIDYTFIYRVGNDCFREFNAFIDGVSAQKGLAAEKRDV